ncbi:hypothetical protein NPIL_534491 [Nephila pilipes]|uniref:Uncharacterized protein n=1 Tax=Nephila pilipes TaxID=299642 RepID=A0A8X6NAB5_NEPPI|nr:hypothetical protein NPIL_534491 [Nephila pilipes]
MYIVPSPERGSSIAPPRNTSRQIQDNQRNIPLPKISNSIILRNNTPRGAISLIFLDFRRITNLKYLVDLAEFHFATMNRPLKPNVNAHHLSLFPTPPICSTVTASHESELSAKKMRDDFCQ